jgi:isovaleryl-CoA dehydrogenase
MMIREAAAALPTSRSHRWLPGSTRRLVPARELWPPMGELGLHGITVEEEWGGLGLGYLDHVVAVEEVSRASASIGLSYGAHSNLCVNQIRRWGTPSRRRSTCPS